MKISEKISQIRKNNNLTQENLADMLGVSRQTVSNWENMKCYPDIETLIMISDKFKVSLDILLKEDKEMVKDIIKKVHLGNIFKKYFLKIMLVLFILIIIGLGIWKVKFLNDNKLEHIKEVKEIVNNIEDIPIKTRKAKANTTLHKANFYIPENAIGHQRNDNLSQIYDIGDIELAILINRQKIGNFIFYDEGKFFNSDKKLERSLEIGIFNYFNYLEKHSKLPIYTLNKMFDYFKKPENQKQSLFYSNFHIKKNANVVNRIYELKNSKIYILSGDITGVMIYYELVENFVAYIYHNGWEYRFHFNDEVFTKERIIEILESIYFTE